MHSCLPYVVVVPVQDLSLTRKSRSMLCRVMRNERQGQSIYNRRRMFCVST